MINTAYTTPTKKEFDRVVGILIERGYKFATDGLDMFSYFGKDTIVHCDSNKTLSVGFILGDGFELKKL